MISVSEKQIEDFVGLFDGDVAAARRALMQFNQKEQFPEKTSPYAGNEIVVSIKDLSKSYKVGKQTVTALREVNMTVRKGEFIAITGASGSGKSTLLHLLGCLDKPTSGRVEIQGKDVAHLSDSKLSELRKTAIGFIFQSFYLQPFLRLGDNISVPSMFTSKKRTAIDGTSANLLKQVGLSERAKHFPKELSGGQIQRAAIARALVNEPSIILADEPTGNLDSANGQAIIDLFQEIRRTLGTTIILVTHDASIAKQADRVIRLKDGVVI